MLSSPSLGTLKRTVICCHSPTLSGETVLLFTREPGFGLGGVSSILKRKAAGGISVTLSTRSHMLAW